MEIAIKKRSSIGRPVTLDPNTKYGFIKVTENIHNTLKSIAKTEERNIQTVAVRIIKKGLKQEGHEIFNSNN